MRAKKWFAVFLVVIVVALLVGNALAAPASARESPPPGCNGTVKVHKEEYVDPMMHDDPKVCDTYLYGHGFDPGSEVLWWIAPQHDKDHPIVGGRLTVQPDGTVKTGPVMLDGAPLKEGQFRLSWWQIGCPGVAKWKVFKVKCCEEPTPECKVEIKVDCIGAKVVLKGCDEAYSIFVDNQMLVAGGGEATWTCDWKKKGIDTSFERILKVLYGSTYVEKIFGGTACSSTPTPTPPGPTPTPTVTVTPPPNGGVFIPARFQGGWGYAELWAGDVLIEEVSPQRFVKDTEGWPACQFYIPITEPTQVTIKVFFDPEPEPAECWSIKFWKGDGPEDYVFTNSVTLTVYPGQVVPILDFQAWSCPGK